MQFDTVINSKKIEGLPSFAPPPQQYGQYSQNVMADYGYEANRAFRPQQPYANMMVQQQAYGNAPGMAMGQMSYDPFSNVGYFPQQQISYAQPTTANLRNWALDAENKSYHN